MITPDEYGHMYRRYSQILNDMLLTPRQYFRMLQAFYCIADQLTPFTDLHLLAHAAFLADRDLEN